jgi:hypothetical protein
MARPHPTAKEEASTLLPGHIFVRYGAIPASGEIDVSIANDKRDGFGRPGRTGIIINANLQQGPAIRFQISADGHNFSNEIILPVFGGGFPNFMQITYDDGVLIHTIRILGVAASLFGIVIAPGRNPEGFIPQFAPVMEEPGPQRKVSRSKLQ